MKTIIAAFRDQTAADEAIAFLNDNGVTDIEVMTGAESGERSRQHLRELNVPDDRAQLYAACIVRGAPVIAAHTDHDAELLARELDRLGSLDLEEAGKRESKAVGEREGVGERERVGEREGIGERVREAAERAKEKITGRETGAAPPSAQGAATSASITGEIDVIEESVRVGKREVPLGAVRVHTFVLERPVREQVELTEERIDVSREAANEPLSPAAAENVLAEEEFVVTARGEEPVVSKEARVVERVHVGKTAETRTETIEETERRRDVEVESIREAEPGPGPRDRGTRR